MRSLRGFLSLWLVLGFTSMAAVSGFSIYWWVQKALIEEFDQTSLSRARAISAFLDYEDGTVGIEYDPSSLPEYADVTGANYFEIYVPAENKLGRSPSMRGKPPIWGKDKAAASHGNYRTQDLTLPDGRPGRSLVLRFEISPDDEDGDEGEGEGMENRPGGRELVSAGAPAVPAKGKVLASKTPEKRLAFITVARSRERLDGQLHTLRWGLGLGAFLFGLLGLFSIRFIVGRGLSQLVFWGAAPPKSMSPRSRPACPKTAFIAKSKL
ncbi:MAG: hypothetical protein V3W41_11410 [Planctomycetota bacterium]